MGSMKELFKAADWKTEKHVPVIDVPEKVKKGEVFQVTVSVGKEVAHPNKTEHHISWIELFFVPEGTETPVQVGKAEFSAHGASADGPDTGGVYTHHRAVLSFKTEKAGTLLAASYCNIHGLWQNDAPVVLAG